MSKNKTVRRRRRSNGEGSIFQRKDGRWVGYVSSGYNDNGQPNRKYFYGDSYLDVAKQIEEYSRKIMSDPYHNVENDNLETLMFRWLMKYKMSSVSSRTFEGNIINFKKHIVPAIGNMKIDKIDKFVIQEFVNNMKIEGFKQDTIKKNKHLINQFFKYAIQRNWVNDNPTCNIKVPKDRDVEEYKALSRELREEFLKALDSEDAGFLKPLCYMGMFSGMRVQEILALQYKHIDLINNDLSVRQAITTECDFDSEGKPINKKVVVRTTKTGSGKRELMVMDILNSVLSEWKNKCLEREKEINNRLLKEGKESISLTGPNAYVFAKDDGSLRTYSGTKTIFDGFKKRHGIERSAVRFHKLRHTFATILFEMKQNPKVIQKLLGHKDVETTLKIYNSIDEVYLKESMNEFQEYFKKKVFDKEKD